MKKYIYFFGIFTLIFCLSFSNCNRWTGNYSTVYINQLHDSFVITVMAEKKLMVHDIGSLIQQKTYTDSEKFEIPRKEGFIDVREIPNVPRTYHFVKGGFTFFGDSIKIDLYYNSSVEGKLDTSGWNGSYRLQWRNDNYGHDPYGSF